MSILWAPGTLCFLLRMTLPMGSNAIVDSSLPALFCCVQATNLEEISGCQDLASKSNCHLWDKHNTIMLSWPGLFSKHTRFSILISSKNITLIRLISLIRLILGHVFVP